MTNGPDEKPADGSNGPLYGVLVCLTAFFVVAAVGNPDWKGIAALAFAERFQTTIAALVALAAALLTVWKISHQVELQRLQIEDDRRRYADAQRSKAWAAKAAMPDALSALCQYAAGCGTYLRNGKGTDQIPNAPIDAINSIKSAIEFVDPQSAEKLFELIVHYQIYNSRLYTDTFGSQPEIQMYDTVYLYALSTRLFEFARNEIDVVPDAELSREYLLSALRQCVGVARYYGNENEFAYIENHIRDRHPEP